MIYTYNDRIEDRFYFVVLKIEYQRLLCIIWYSNLTSEGIKTQLFHVFECFMIYLVSRIIFLYPVISEVQFKTLALIVVAMKYLYVGN